MPVNIDSEWMYFMKYTRTATSDNVTVKPKLCVLEEQEIFRKLYPSIFSTEFDLDILETPLNAQSTTYIKNIVKPDLLLLSVKRLNENIFNQIMEFTREPRHPGIVLILLSYSQKETEWMRKVISSSKSGMALFLKKSLDLTDQLVGIIRSVRSGQVILDPVLSPILLANRSDCPFLKQMTTREQEILALLSNGLTNDAIAKDLYIDIKTVEHHINNLYGKMKSIMDFDRKHPRVEAARLYLEAVGELPQKANIN
jgi:DNA-binding NarL/FixJ family response regulator